MRMLAAILDDYSTHKHLCGWLTVIN